MKVTLFIIVVFFSSFSFGQNTLTGVVLDEGTNKGVPYVNIALMGTSTGTVSADDGSFSLDCDTKGILVLSSIGYEVKKIDLATAEDGLKVNLTPKSYNFKSINIVATKLKGKPKTYGMDNIKRGNSISYGGNYLGSEMASIIKIKEPTYIKSANFMINHARGDSMFFRVKVYDFKDKVLGDNLLKENVIIAKKQMKGLLTIDMSHLDLIVSDDVLLSLEWIKGDGEKGNESLTFNTKKKGKARGVYLRYNSVIDFERMKFINNHKLSFYFTGYPYGDN